MRNLSFAIAILLSALLSVRSVAAEAKDVDFELQIRPLLQHRCVRCHGPAERDGGLRLDAQAFAFKGGDGGKVITPGDSGSSELIRRVSAEDELERMPPEGKRLSDAEIKLLRQWIDGGANWPETQYDRDARKDPRREHWSFQPLRFDENSLDGQPSVDAFLRDQLASKGMSMRGKADRRTRLRRLYFDLHGLPPTFRQIEAFKEAEDDSAAWKRAIDEALASPRYGERWAQHWLDVVRYADTHGFEVNTPRENAWPYRDYVIAAFNSDKPYDQFLREQLIGDALGVDQATGFLVAAAVLLPGQIGKDDASKRLARQDSLDEIIQGASATMLGLTIGCARCHDHKFDPITQRDYYAMQAFFAGVRYGDRPIQEPADSARSREVADLSARAASLERDLHPFAPRAFTGRTLVIDETDAKRTEFLMKENGPGANPAGVQPGYRDDPGGQNRLANISGGRYTWWNNKPGVDVMCYRPGEAGRFQLWISWGAHGSGVHTRDARYVLDRDGDVTTRDDQQPLATIDQYYRVGVATGETEKKPLWSGLQSVGVVELEVGSAIIVRGGETGGGVTADVIVLQEIETEAEPTAWPRLRQPVSPASNEERFEPSPAKFIRFTTFETIDNNRHEPCIDELQVFDVSGRNVALATHGAKATSSGNYSNTGKHQLAHINDGRFSNDFSWISNQRGGGWVQIELPEERQLQRIVWGRDRTGKFKDRLPVDYRIEISRDGSDWRTIAASQDRVAQGTPFDAQFALLRRASSEEGERVRELSDQLSAVRKRLEMLKSPRLVYGGVFQSPTTTHVLRRGDPEQPVEPIEPAIPELFQVSALATTEVSGLTEEQRRRWALAEWIASPKNPLTARVIVNRIWLQHFGLGLVASPSDFGLNGARPSHPQLLDWLALELIRSGWSIKHVHRLILESAAYQQLSDISGVAADLDSDNRWYWRFSSRRLEGEAIRDSMLAISGELNLKMGGPGFDLFKSRGGLNGFPPVEKFESNQLRRMIYAHKIRMERTPVFGAFDCPDAGQSTPVRSRSTTPLQALNLFNSQFVLERANAFAARIRSLEPEAEASRQVELAFQLALGRSPTATERAASVPTIQQHGLPTLCRVLFNCNEFLFLP